MQTSNDGKAVMHYFESCQLQAYPDPASPLFKAMRRDGVDPYHLPEVPSAYAGLSGAPWTIGWGDTRNVTPGQVITQAEADQRYADRLTREFEPGVLDALQYEPTQGQFDAFVSLAYNIGMGNFKDSTALRKFNARDDVGACAGILMWNKAGGIVMLGLRRRRVAESALYQGKSASAALSLARAVS